MNRIAFGFLLGLYFAMDADAVFAGTDTPMGTVLCTTANWFAGNLGTGLETLSVAIFGVFALLGKVSWGMALIDAVAVAGLHSAGLIVTSLNAGATGC